jgi:hypothetical protein
MCKTGHQEGAKSVKLQDIDKLHGVLKFCIRAIQTLIAKSMHATGKLMARRLLDGGEEVKEVLVCDIP